MHFAGIDVPQELVTAHAEGSVVLFVGAGASMARPTSLPNFGELARRVAERVGVTADAELLDPDLLLGRLKAERGVPVHRLVEQEILKGKRRNALHTALAALSAAAGPVRIVTTNYDDHMHRALKAARVPHAVFEAPALPAGYDFEGLVHLHGRLGQPPERWVVTDSDFGSAYITRGWAPAFLRDLFAKYVVCFVGYSHEDRMMEYLAKGLPSDARPRFILTDNSDAYRWGRLGITPIPYPAGQHAVLVDLAGLWATSARDTPFDRAARIQRLAGEAPPADPDDHDFLVNSMAHARLAVEICNLATSKAWIEWIFEQRPVQVLLGQDSGPSDIEKQPRVADWIASVALDSKWFEDVYALVSSARGTVDARLASAILWQIIHAEADPRTVSTWLRWLLTRARGGGVPTDEFELLWGSKVSLQWPDTMLLLDHLANTWGIAPPSLFGGWQTPQLRLRWGFREGTRRLERLNPQESAEFLRWLTAYLEQAHLRIASAAGGFDSWSFGRSSIGTHEQDSISRDKPEHVLVSCGRDTLARVRIADAALAKSTREVWLSSRAPLLQRLALHDLATAPEVLADERIEAVLAGGNIFKADLHHEVYELLAAAVPHLTETRFSALVEVVSAGPDESEEETPASPGPSAEDRRRWRDRKVYNLLHWLSKHRREAEQPTALREIQLRYPQWEFDDAHPDFTHYMTSGSRSIEDDHPWSPEDFHAKVTAAASEAVDELLAIPPANDDDFWWGGGDMVRATVAQWPDDGLLLWPHAPVRLRIRVLEGWSTAPLSSEQLEAVMAILRAEDLTGLSDAVARMLHPWSGESWARERWLWRADARTLARRALAAWWPPTSGPRDGDLESQAINSTPGALAGYWIAVAAAEARAGTFPGGGLSTDVAGAFEELLHPSTFRPLVVVCLLEQLDFLFRADPAWARRHLLPALDPVENPWGDVEAYWSTVLRGRISEQLLQAGILDWLVTCAEHVDAGADLGRTLANMASVVAVHSSMDDPDRLAWITRFIAAAPIEVTISWTGEVASKVADLDPEARTSLWRRWMRSVLAERVAGAPRLLTEPELTALTMWIALLPHVTDVRTGVDLLLSAHGGFASLNTHWGGLSFPEDALQSHANEWTRLIGAMLRQTATLPRGLVRSLNQAVATLRGASADEGLLSIIDRELFRLSD